MVSALDYHFRGPGFKTTIWYLGRLNLYPSEVDKIIPETRVELVVKSKLSPRSDSVTLNPIHENCQ